MTNIYLEFDTEPLRRPFTLCNLDFEPRACALGFPVSPLRGLASRQKPAGQNVNLFLREL